MPGAPDTTTAKILETMGRIGPHDVKTIAEIAGVGRSTANRKLNQWLAEGTVARIPRGDDPAHWTVTIPADAPPADDVAHQATVTEPGDTQDADAAAEPAVIAPPVQDDTAGSSESSAITEPAEADPPGGPEVNRTDQPASTVVASVEPPAETQPAARKRRENGAIETMGLAILNDNPENSYTPGELARLAERRELADGVPPAQAKVAAGAMINAMNKAAGLGKCVRVGDKPARYQAARP